MLPQIARFFQITMDELFGYTLEHKLLKIINQYHFGLSLDDVDMCILDYGTVEECGVHKREVLAGDKFENTWEVRVHFISTEDSFPHTLQKHIKQGVLVDGYSVRIADGKVIDDDKPNKHYVCKEKVWEYKNTDRKYLYQMLKEQIAMGLIKEDNTW